MEGLDTEAARFMEDLLDFSSDIGEGDEDDDEKAAGPAAALPPPSSSLHLGSERSASLPEEVAAEEELEWISNKDAFPEVEAFVDIIPCQPVGNFVKQRSPVSVLEASNAVMGAAPIASCCANFQVPVRARSKRCRRRRRLSGLPDGRCWWYICEKKKIERTAQYKASGGRKCLHCQADKTPQWRAGPDGPKTLCNACGVRYKSGRLVPEYRPANSPTFSSRLHSNSHRKIMEMRRLKATETG